MLLLDVTWCMHRPYCTILLYLSNQCKIYVNNICCWNNLYMSRYRYIILRVFIINYAKVTELITWKHIISSLIFSCSSPLDKILFYPENGGRNCFRNIGKGLPEPTWRITTRSILIYTHLFHILTNKLGKALFLILVSWSACMS